MLVKFNKETHKVDIKTMNKTEAKAFIRFLQSEGIRHADDIKDLEVLIEEVKRRFEL